MKAFTLLVISALLAGTLHAQTNYNLASGDLIIKGTSSMHDWDLTVGTVNMTATIDASANQAPMIETLNLKVKVASLQSTKGRIMDGKTHTALKESEHPYIFFKFNKILSATNKGSYYLLNASGDLTIAGVTKPVVLEVKTTLLDNGNIRFEGKKDLKMTTFGIDPPTALLGTLKTGDDIVIEFNTLLTTSGL